MNTTTGTVIDRMEALCSCRLRDYNDTFLQKAVLSRMQQCNCTSAEEYILLLETSESEFHDLLRSLNNSYSEFFRIRNAFSLLENSIIPQIFSRATRCRSRQIRIWSAGCAAGQEAFSVAMLFEQFVQKHEPGIPYRVIATDKSEEQIKIASNAEYEKYQLDNITLKQWETFFLKSRNGRFTLNPDIRSKVSFSVFDLTDFSHSSPPTSIFGGFDLILCCNLLYYYNSNIEDVIIAKLVNNLNPNGFLITDEAEKGIIKRNRQLKQFSFSAPVFEKKNNPEISTLH